MRRATQEHLVKILQNGFEKVRSSFVLKNEDGDNLSGGHLHIFPYDVALLAVLELDRAGVKMSLPKKVPV